MTSEELLAVAHQTTKRLLARALYEWDDMGAGPFDKLPEFQRDAFLDQAAYVLDHFNVNPK